MKSSLLLFLALLSLPAHAAAPSITTFTADVPAAPLGSTFTLRWKVNNGGDPSTILTLLETGADLTSVASITVQPAALVPVFDRSTVGWRVYNELAAPPSDWNMVAFDDSAWIEPSTPPPIGYGETDGPLSTIIIPPGNHLKPNYFRRTFQLTQEQLTSFEQFAIELVRDDGAAVYVNGQEVLRSFLPSGTITHDTIATTSADPAIAFYRFPVSKSAFVAGTNTVAVFVSPTRSGSTSFDLRFDLGLFGEKTATPTYTLQAENASGTVQSVFTPAFAPADATQPIYLSHSVDGSTSSWSAPLWSNGLVIASTLDYQMIALYGARINTSASVPTFGGRSLTIHPGAALYLTQTGRTVGDLRLAGGSLISTIAATFNSTVTVQKDSLLDGGSFSNTLNAALVGSGRLRLHCSDPLGTFTLAKASPSFTGSLAVSQGRLNVAGTAVLNNAPVLLDGGVFAPTAAIVSTGPLTITNLLGTAQVRLDQNLTFSTVTLPDGTPVPAGTYTFASLPVAATPYFVSGAGTLSVVPVLTDADADGLEDSWEQSQFGGLSALPGDDPDHDGVSNLGEYLAQTNPNNPSSTYRVASPVASASSLAFTLNTVSGVTYKLQSAATLGAGTVWTDVPSASVLGDGSTKTLTAPTGTSTQFFVRVVLVK